MASLFQSFGFGKSADIRVGYHFSGLTLAYGQLKKKKERKGEKKRAREKEREGDRKKGDSKFRRSRNGRRIK